MFVILPKKVIIVISFCLFIQTLTQIGQSVAELFNSIRLSRLIQTTRSTLTE